MKHIILTNNNGGLELIPLNKIIRIFTYEQPKYCSDLLLQLTEHINSVIVIEQDQKSQPHSTDIPIRLNSTGIDVRESVSEISRLIKQAS